MKVHDAIGARLQDFIERQHLFFVATAPLSGTGHVNVSPKGMGDTFAVVDEHTVAYLDVTGSGSETVAHLRENGRITVMFCAFDGAPNIVRLHGVATSTRTTPSSPLTAHGSATTPVFEASSSSTSSGCPTPAATRFRTFPSRTTEACSTPGPTPGARRALRPTTANATPPRSTGSPPSPPTSPLTEAPTGPIDRWE